MSLLTMASIGIGRDLANEGETLARDTTVSKTRVVPADPSLERAPAPTPGGGQPAKQTATVASFGQLLVAQIPSETLLAYTTLLALFTAAGSSASYRVGRWIVYAAAIAVSAVAVIVGYLAQRDYGFTDTKGASPPVAGDRGIDAGGQVRPPPPGTPPVSAAAGSAAPLTTLGGEVTAPSTPTTAFRLEPTTMPAATASAAPPPVAAPAPTVTKPRSSTRNHAVRVKPTSTLARLHLPILPTVAAMLSMAVYGLTVPGSPLQFEVSGPAFAIWSGCLAVTGGVLMSTIAPFLGRGNSAVTLSAGDDTGRRLK